MKSKARLFEILPRLIKLRKYKEDSLFPSETEELEEFLKKWDERKDIRGAFEIMNIMM